MPIKLCLLTSPVLPINSGNIISKSKPNSLYMNLPITPKNHEKRTVLSLIKNHPTLKVIPITKDTEEVAND